MDLKHLSASQFADAMEVPRAVVSHVLSGRNKPSLDVVLKIASTYSDVNLEWLLLGKGEILTPLVPLSEAKELQNPALPDKEPDAPSDQNLKTVVGNVQYEEPAVTSPVVSKAPARVVNQVMIFYTDGTFESFKPSS